MKKKTRVKAKGKPAKAHSTKVSPNRKYFLIFLFTASIGLYANTLGHQYAFDDSIVITENPYTKSGIKGIPTLLTSDFFLGIYGYQTELSGGRYRPLSLLTFAIEYQFFGESPFIGHLFNIIYYGICLVLLFLVLEQFFGRGSPVPYISTLLFLVHPIHTEVVANIKSRDEILCFIFLLLTFYSLFRSWRSEQKTKWIVTGVITYFLSLLAKETSITFLPLFPLALYIFADAKIKKSLMATLPYLLVGIAYILLRTAIVGIIGGEEPTDIMENPYVNSGFNEKFATIFLVLLKYLSLLFVPYPLTSDYSFNHIPFVSFGSPLALAGILIYLGMSIFALWKIKDRSVPAFAILFYLAPLSIVSNIVFNIGAPMGERFLFIPSAGFCILIGYFAERLIKVKEGDPLRAIWSNRILSFSCLAIMVVFSILTLSRNGDWYNNQTLFKKDVETAPNSAKMRYYYANSLIQEYLKDKDPEKKPLLDSAEYHLLKGLEINPDFVFLTYNLGLVYSNKDQGDLAKYYLEKTLELQPGHMKAYRMLGEVNGRLFQDYEKALSYLETAYYQYGDNDPGLLQNLGNVYAMKGEHQKALEVFGKLLETNPANPQYYINLGLTWQGMGDQAKADEYFRQAEAKKSQQ